MFIRQLVIKGHESKGDNPLRLKINLFGIINVLKVMHKACIRLWLRVLKLNRGRKTTRVFHQIFIRKFSLYFAVKFSIEPGGQNTKAIRPIVIGVFQKWSMESKTAEF